MAIQLGWQPSDLRDLLCFCFVGGPSLPTTPSNYRKIEDTLAPSVFKLVNESHKHSGHYTDDGTAAYSSRETHFKWVVIEQSGTCPRKICHACQPRTCRLMRLVNTLPASPRDIPHPFLCYLLNITYPSCITWAHLTLHYFL